MIEVFENNIKNIYGKEDVKIKNGKKEMEKNDKKYKYEILEETEEYIIYSEETKEKRTYFILNSENFFVKANYEKNLGVNSSWGKMYLIIKGVNASKILKKDLENKQMMFLEEKLLEYIKLKSKERIKILLKE